MTDEVADQYLPNSYYVLGMSVMGPGQWEVSRGSDPWPGGAYSPACPALSFSAMVDWPSGIYTLWEAEVNLRSSCFNMLWPSHLLNQCSFSTQEHGILRKKVILGVKSNVIPFIECSHFKRGMQGEANCLDKWHPCLSGGSGRLEKGGLGDKSLLMTAFLISLTCSDGNSCI